MNHGQIRYANGYTNPNPYGPSYPSSNTHLTSGNNTYGSPYQNAEASASQASISSLASTSSKIIGLFKAGKEKVKKVKRSRDEGPPVPEKDIQYKGPYAGGVLQSASSLSLSASVSDASGHSHSQAGHSRDLSSASGNGSVFGRKKGKRRDKDPAVGNVSTPWNVKHELHVSDELQGFPPEWQSSLLSLGYSPKEIQQMIDAKRRQPAMHQNLIPIGPNATTSLHTTNLNIALLQNQAMGLEALHSGGSGALAGMGGSGGGLSSQSQGPYNDTMNSGLGGGFKYPSPPNQFALPTLQQLPSLQTDLSQSSRRFAPTGSNTSSPITAPAPHNPLTQSALAGSQFRSNSPALRSGSPALRHQPDRTGSPALRQVPDRTNSPASSTRSHPTQEGRTHQTSISLSGSDSRASPVPSLRRDGSALGASGLSSSPVTSPPIPTRDATTAVTTQISMGLASNTMSSTTPVKTSPPPNPINPRVPTRPSPAPPLFGSNSTGNTSERTLGGAGGGMGISTDKARAYKPLASNVIVVQDEEEEDDRPLGALRVVNGAASPDAKSTAGANSFLPSTASTSSNSAGASTQESATTPNTATPMSNTVLSAAQSARRPAAPSPAPASTGVSTAAVAASGPFTSTSTIASVSSSSSSSSFGTPSSYADPPVATAEKVTGSGTGATTLTPTPTTALSGDAPPRLSLGIPRISLEFGKLDLGLGVSNDSDAKKEHQSVDWSESLFSALPSATAFGGFRTSVVLPGSGRGSPAISPGISPVSRHTPSPSGTTISPGLGTSPGLGSSPNVARTVLPSFTSPSPVPSTTKSIHTSTPSSSSTMAFGRPSPAEVSHIRQISRSPLPEARQSIQSTITDRSSIRDSLQSIKSPEIEARPRDSSMVDTRTERASVMSGDSIASSNLLGHGTVLGHDNERYRDSMASDMTERYRDSTASDITTRQIDRYRESVSTESTDSTFRQSVSSYGGEDEEHDNIGETVVVARATAVKLARAPSVALRNGFDAFAVGRNSALMNAPPQRLEFSTSMYEGFDEEEEEDSDEGTDSDEEEEEEEEEDPNSRYTIRLDNANADRLMDAVMKSGGETDHLNLNGENGRPSATTPTENSTSVSAATVGSVRPVSTATVRFGATGKEEIEATVGEEDSSALDDWLEANEGDRSDDMIEHYRDEKESPKDEEGSDRSGSEYDDTGYPLSALAAQEIRPFDDQEEKEPPSPGSDGSTYEDSPIKELPASKSIHTRTPGSGSLSRRSYRSSMVYAPAPHVRTESHARTESQKSINHIPDPRAVASLPKKTQQLLQPLAPFVLKGDPRALYSDLQLIAEGESGGIYAARTVPTQNVVAIKRIAVHDETSTKLQTVGRELTILDGARHINILTYAGIWLFNDESASPELSTEVWVRMNLMERSLADLLGLLEDGLILEEKHVARFAKDAASGLAFLESRLIAHRDVRSDNLLVSNEGIVKLADFANAVQLSQEDTVREDQVGIIYWQAPEIRRGLYDATKVDVWSLGATVWELIEGETPFESDPNGPSDRLPELSRRDVQQVSQGLINFFNACEAPPERRSTARALLDTPFVRAACPREDIINVLSQALEIEQAISAG